jgi:hypothetical protein
VSRCDLHVLEIITNPRIRCIVRLEERTAILEIDRVPRWMGTALAARSDPNDASVDNVAAKLARQRRNDPVK